MDRYKITFETWNKVASVYQDKFMQLEMYNDTYDIFCFGVKQHNAGILEIGCGPGNITTYMLHKRPDFKIMAIDVAHEMIKLAIKSNPAADFKIMDCREIDKLTGKFDGIVCGFCMPYLSQSDCTKLISDMYVLLKENGILYFSTIEGEYSDSGFETGSTGDRAYVYYHSEDFFRQELKANHFEITAVIRKEPLKPQHKKQNELIIIARK